MRIGTEAGSLNYQLHPPNNLFPVKKLGQQGGEVTFGKDAHIKTSDGTLLPLMLTARLSFVV